MKHTWLITTAIIASIAVLPACAPKEPAETNTAAASADQTTKTDVAAPASDNNNDNNTAVVAPDATDNKILVAYFSATGTTAGVAKIISETTGGTLFEIVPETKYTDADLDWRNENSRSSVEMKDPASRPKIVGSVDKLDNYNTVFLGYPIWWNVAPHAVNTFIEANNLAGKKVIPFCTAGSSSIDNSVVELRKVLPDSNVVDGKKWFSTTTRDDIAGWLTELGISAK